MAIYDAMQYVKADVSTVCLGMGMSAGAMVLCGGAAGKRFALPNAKIMIHQGSGGFRGTPADIAVAAAHGAIGPGQIRITDVQISYSYVTAKGQRTGAVELVKQRLYNPSVSEKAIGRATVVCTFFDARERNCTGTYFLPKGSLVVTGAIQSRLLYDIAVGGGTGLYDNARGTLTVTSTGLRPKRREVLLFRLTG